MIRTYKTRIDVIRNGATFIELHAASPPVIDCNSYAMIKSSMAGVFYDNADVNWLTDELKPYQIIDGIEYPVGVFMAASVKYQTDANGAKTISVEAYDRCLRLQQTRTESILHIAEGSNYISAIEQLLVNAGIDLWLSTPTTKTTSTDREDWPIGTPFLEIINTLLAEISYSSIWFDVNGYAVLSPMKTPSASHIDHQYGVLESVKVIQKSSSKELDIYDAPNVFVAICENPDLPEPLIATAENNNPASPLSVYQRKRRIVKTYKVNNIPDQSSLEAYVQQIMGKSMLSEETVFVETANLPNHMAFDTVALSHPDISGLFQEISWRMTLEPGSLMQHTLRRSVLYG